MDSNPLVDKAEGNWHLTRPYVLIVTGFCTVANTLQAKKRARQAVVRNERNNSMRSMFRTYIKNVVKAIEAGDKAKAEASYKAAVPVIDKLCNKDIVSSNKAARHKSRLNARIRAMT